MPPHHAGATARAPAAAPEAASSCWPCCGSGHDHAVVLAHELSRELTLDFNHTKYIVHGQYECDWPKGYKDKDGICLAELL